MADEYANLVERFGHWKDGGILWDQKMDDAALFAFLEKRRGLLEGVVSQGGGKKAYIEGYEIGGKTATSQMLPRSEHQYIASFLGFAPADDPQVLLMVIIKKPQGTYYGGTIAAPVAREIFENILPYLNITKES